MKVRTWWTVLCAAGLVVNAAAAGAQENRPGYRDPKTAATWGWLVPGAGHLYAGESGKGWLLMGASVGALAGGLTMTLTSGDDISGGLSNSFDPYDDSPRDYGSADDLQDWTPAYIGLGAFTLGWLYSVIDAPKAAVRENSKRGLGLLPGRVMPYVGTRGNGPEYGVRVSIAL